MQRDEKAAFAVHPVFLDQDLFEAKILDVGAAVFFLGPNHEITLFTGFAKRLAIHVPLLTPTLSVRPDLGLKKTPRGIAELIVFGFEDGAEHKRSLCILGTRH